jgi:tellurite resistance protein
MVYLVTGSTIMGLAELVIHAATDYANCDGRITSTQDQAIHYMCKILWAVLAVYGRIL